MSRLVVCFIAVALLAPAVARAATISVHWFPDGSFDGLAAGTLGGIPVSLSSTNGLADGGNTFATNWASNLGSNDVPGIGDAGVFNEAAHIDWNVGAAGFATITFGSSVTDPILLFNFTDAVVETFDFADAIPITILDANPVGSVIVAPGNVVTTNGTHQDSANDGFSIQLDGAFTSISFATNVNLNVGGFQSVGFSVATVPEPSVAICSGAALLALLREGRRRGHRIDEAESESEEGTSWTSLFLPGWGSV